MILPSAFIRAVFAFGRKAGGPKAGRSGFPIADGMNTGRSRLTMRDAMLSAGLAVSASVGLTSGAQAAVFSYDNDAVADPTISISATACSAPMAVTFDVTDTFDVGTITAGLNMTHSYRADIEAKLISPLGTEVYLTRDNGFSADDFDMLLDDASATPIGSAVQNVAAPLYDSIRSPNQPLYAFAGEAALGTWTLEICDDRTGDDGVFGSARLNFDDTPAVTVDISLAQTISATTPEYDEALTVTVDVLNSSANDGAGLSVQLSAPVTFSYSGYSQVSISHGSVNSSTGLWTIGTLAAGQTATLVYTSPARAGTGTYRAYLVSSANIDPDSTPGNTSTLEDDTDSGTVTTSPAAGHVPPGGRNVCYKDYSEIALDGEPNTWAKLSNPSYFGSGGSVAPEELVHTGFWQVTDTLLTDYDCDIWLGGGNPDETQAESTEVYSWHGAGNRYVIGACDYTHNDICNDLRSNVAIANGNVDLNGALAYNPLTCGGASGVATYGGASTYFVPQGSDVILGQHNTAGEEVAIIADAVNGGTFLFLPDADMLGSNGATPIGSGSTADTDQAKLVLNTFKLALDEIAGRTVNQCVADYNNPPGVVSGFVYVDENLDNIYQAGTETALQNVTVSIYSDGGTAGDTNDDLLFASVETDANGAYSFSVSQDNTYRIEVDAADPDLDSRPAGTANPINSVSVTTGGTTSDQNFAFDGDAGACTTTVNTAADSGIGSLRAAIACANADPADDLITFDIGGGGAQTIVPLSPLPGITDAGVIIDGSTQTGASCGSTLDASGAITDRAILISLDGSSAGTGADGLSIGATDGVTIKGLSVGNFPGGGISVAGSTNSTIICNHLGLAADGSTPAANSGAGIVAAGADTLNIGDGTVSGYNVIGSNALDGIRLTGTLPALDINRNYIGVAIDGSTLRGNGTNFSHRGVHFVNGTSVVSDGAQIRNNVITGNAGTAIAGFDAVTNLAITDNMIGMDATGATLLSESAGVYGEFTTGWTLTDNIVGSIFNEGVNLNDGTATLLGNTIEIGVNGNSALALDGGGPYVVGGTGAGEGNTISGGAPGFSTVLVKSGASATIAGNTIRDAGQQGIQLFGSGSSATIHSNTITNSGRDEPNNAGIEVGSNTSAAIYANSISGNSGLGIDLDGGTENSFRVTANDSGDADTGPNELLNFPVINSFTVDGTTDVAYDINVDVPGNGNGYRIDFFKNTAADASGHGEGETHLGSVDVSHAGGDLNFTGSFTANTGVSGDDIISATTTRKTSGVTYDISSEFSAIKAATGNCTLVVDTIADSGYGSLRDAIDCANTFPDRDAITFNIAGAGPHVISPATLFADVTDDGVSIDGSTQSGASCGTATNANRGITDRDLRIVIDGSGLASGDALKFSGGVGGSVKGMVIGGAPGHGLNMDFVSATASVTCSHIGVNAAGTAAFGNGATGLRLASADDAIVGDGSIAGANVFGGNALYGLSYRDNHGAGSIRRNFMGVGIDGVSDIPNGSGGLALTDSGYGTPIQIGDKTGGGNVISGNTGNGVFITNGRWEFYGNHIGTDGAGLSAVPNGGHGISGPGESLILGDGTTAGRNIIAGNTGDGLYLKAASDSETIIDGNLIGIAANDAAIGNGGSGINFFNFSGTEGASLRNNTIANNGADGISIVSGATDTAAIYANEIYNNTGLGIDLGGGTEDASGVTANDSGGGDADTGTNDLLNFPEINTFRALGTTDVEYDINVDVPANANGYRIDFFKNSATDPSLHGEGETHLGSVDIAHAGGDLNFTGSFVANTGVSGGDVISATTTRKTSGVTYDISSEFSAIRVATDDCTLTVNKIADGGYGSLREAINCANLHTDRDAITFDITGAGPHVIALASGLPAVTDADISIDGTTQSGATCGNLWSGSPHSLQIEIDAGNGAFDALTVAGDGILLKGLAIHGTDGDNHGGHDAVEFTAASSNSALHCSYIGHHADGSDAGVNSGGYRGAFIQGDSITIGGAGSADGNVIGNSWVSSIRTEAGATDLIVEGNFLTTDPTGMIARPSSHGVQSANGAVTWRYIRNNLISGASSEAVYTLGDGVVTGSSGDVVIAGNYIGTDRTGNAALANDYVGIYFDGNSISGAAIGGTAPADRNVISGNGADGILLSSVSDVTILGNHIGIGADGATALGNGTSGISARNVTTVTIGDGSAAGRNVIGSNINDGIELRQTIDGVVIDGNYIGLAADGDTARGNGTGYNGAGIKFQAATSDGDIIRNNIISDNGTGVHSLDGSVTNVLFTGNYVGTDATGLLPRGNEYYAVNPDVGADGWIFGTPASGNVVSATRNSGSGFEIYSGAHTFQNNKIGVGVDGTTPLGNEGWGVRLYSGPHVVGGTGANEGNIIANSGSNGSFANLLVQGGGAATVSGNIIRDGKGYAAIDITNAGTVVTLHDNTITGDLGAGIQVGANTQLYAYNNTITDNGEDGVRVSGTTAKAALYANSISGNGHLGIDLGASGVTANDSGDADTGSNDLLNFPVINSFTVDGTTDVAYDINVDVPGNGNGYRIDFFKNTAADASGHGEGETHLGSVDVSHAGGDLNFTGSFTANTGVSGDDIISATTTRKTSGVTYDISSEFSAIKAAEAVFVAPDSPDVAIAACQAPNFAGISPDGLEDLSFPTGYWAASYYQGRDSVSENNGSVGTPTGSGIFRGEAFWGSGENPVWVVPNGSADSFNRWANNETPTDPTPPPGYAGSIFSNVTTYQIDYRRKMHLPGSLVFGGGMDTVVDDNVEVFVNGTRVYGYWPGGGAPDARPGQGVEAVISLAANDEVLVRFANLGSIGGMAFRLDVPGYDCSDAPTGGTSYGVASHIQHEAETLYLGATNDDDTADLSSANADGDGAEDDGVTVPTLISGATSAVTIPQADLTGSGTGTLHGWIDFNDNGAFEAAEYASVGFNNGATGDLIFTSYGTTASIGTTFARFRVTTDPLTAAQFATSVSDGEVEDYQVSIVSQPVVSNGVLNYATSGNGRHQGSIALLDWASSSLSRGIITNGDTVNFALPGCRAGTLTASFSNVAMANPTGSGEGAMDIRDMAAVAGAGAHLGYNGPGAGESIHVRGETSPTLPAELAFTIDWSMTVNGQSQAPDIVFFDTETSTGGEFVEATTTGGVWSLVENLNGSDYTAAGIGSQTVRVTKTQSPSHVPVVVSMNTSRTSVTLDAGGNQAVGFGVLLPCDFGDAAYGTPSHAFEEEPVSVAAADGLQPVAGQPRLGSFGPDAEQAPQGTGGTGDDSDVLGDDEDGVTFGTLVAGTSITLPVSVSGSGFLNAWIDWDGNGSFDAPTEQIAADVQDPGGSGTINLAVNVPSYAVAGQTFARFRWSGAFNIGSGGSAPDGEVEDYQVTIGGAGVALAGRVFVDNGSGATAYDAVKGGLEGDSTQASVSLFDGSGAFIATVPVGGGGTWAYVLPPSYSGAVTVAATALPGWMTVSEQTAGLPSLSNANAHDGTFTFTPVSGASYSTLDVGLLARPSLTENQSAAIIAGQVVLLPHRYEATGPASVSFALTDVIQNPAGAFASAIYRDVSCDGTLDSFVDAPVSVVAGESVCLAVRTQAASGIGAGASVTYGLTATTSFTGTSLVTALRNDDRIGAGGGGDELLLRKLVTNLSIPGAVEGTANIGNIGDTLQYRIVFTNPGNGPANDILVTDATPAYTALAGPIAPSVTVAPGITCALQVPAAGNTAGYVGPLQWQCPGAFPPGAEGSVTFRVQISP